ncbi:hypothetical protein LCDV1gp004 [Lymphocystis disease virus 1]|uniref:hypothetical protein n=1 Tax=Fish lymphocystis disease virus TaxID=36363 RepID=UPI0000161EE0|nr:hypothetical protein LCDV1gp004 [Lymphocystis disease virus 1]
MLQINKIPLEHKQYFPDANFEPITDLYLDMITNSIDAIKDYRTSNKLFFDGSDVTVDELKEQVNAIATYNINNWKKYLIIFTCLTELLLTKFNIKAQGFAQYQIKNISTYNDLLAELAEKYNLPETKLPIEIRLLLTICMNVVLFTLGSFIPEKEILLDLLQNL